MAKRLDRKLIFYFFAVLIFTILAGMCFSAIQRELADFEDQLKFNLSRVQNIINMQASTYIYGLQGARGVIMADGNKYNPQLFRQYSESREFYANFKGLIGYGFIRRVNPQNLDRYLVGKNFSFKKNTAKKDDYLIVETFEKFENGPELLGQDLSEDSFVQKVIWSAAEKNTAVLTDLTIVKRRDQTFPGFIYLLPVYSQRIDTNTVIQDRLKETIGWIFGPMILSEFLQIFEDAAFNNFHLHIFIGQSDYLFETGSDFDRKSVIKNFAEANFEVLGKSWQIKLYQPSQAVVRRIQVILFQNFVTFIVGLLCLYLLVRLYDRQSRSIEEKENWLNAVLSNSAHSIIAVDPSGTIRTFSAASEKMFGYKASEVIGRATPMIFHDQSRLKERAEKLTLELGFKVESGLEALIAKAKLGLIDTYEWVFTRKDGRRVPVRCTVTAIKDADDAIIGFMSVCEDLTDFNKIQEKLNHEQAQLMNASKLSLLGEMAGGIAHEINTPLAIIVGKTNTLREKVKLGLSIDATIIQLTKISQTATRIGRITKSLLTYARSSEKDPPIVQSASYVVQTTLDLCSDKIKATGIQLMLDYSTPMQIEVRQGEVIQILTNLINNSIDAVKIQKNPWIEIKTVAKNGRCEIWVTDSGLGIDVSIQDKILHPFFTTKPVGDGTGLGLSISKSLAEGLKGELFLDTQSKNTRFIASFTLK